MDPTDKLFALDSVDDKLVEKIEAPMTPVKSSVRKRHYFTPQPSTDQMKRSPKKQNFEMSDLKEY
jgi:hypothetical protein